MNLNSLSGDSSIHDGVHDILGYVYGYLDFEKIVLGSRNNIEWDQILRYLIFIRFLEPSSKLRSVDLILKRFQKAISHDQILRLMDNLSKREPLIKRHLAEKMLEVGIRLRNYMRKLFASSLEHLFHSKCLSH